MTQPGEAKRADRRPTFRTRSSNQARRDRAIVKIRLMDGNEFDRPDQALRSLRAHRRAQWRRPHGVQARHRDHHHSTGDPELPGAPSILTGPAGPTP